MIYRKYLHKSTFLSDLSNLVDTNYFHDQLNLNTFEFETSLDIKSCVELFLNKNRINRNYFEISISALITLKFKIRKYGPIEFVKLIGSDSIWLNEDFYKLKYPDVPQSGNQLALHYWRYGYFEGRQPMAGVEPAIKSMGLQELYSFTNDANFQSQELGSMLFISPRDIFYDSISVPEIQNKNIFKKAIRTFDKNENFSSENIKVSFIIPCWNQTSFLNECLVSVANSTSDIHECIVIDDGNIKDNSLRDLDSLLPVQAHQELVIISQNNCGLAAARNTGIENARGQFLKFIDSDDLLVGKSVDHQIDALGKSNSDYCVGQHILYVEGEDEFIFSNYSFDEVYGFANISEFFKNPESFFTGWEQDFSIPIHSLLVKSEVVPKFNEELKSKEDLAFWIALLLKSKSVVFTHQYVSIYRQHKKQMTNTNLHLNGLYYWLAWKNIEMNYSTINLNDAQLNHVVKFLKNKYGQECIEILRSFSAGNKAWLMSKGI